MEPKRTKNGEREKSDGRGGRIGFTVYVKPSVERKITRMGRLSDRKRSSMAAILLEEAIKNREAELSPSLGASVLGAA